MSSEEQINKDKKTHTVLEFPYISIIPYSVMSCTDLEPNAKLHYGCLAGLSKKEGYCWATDEQLAEMHKVSERQIKRWNDSLEKNGFIKRITENKPYEDSSGRWLWKKKRKIYVSEGFSKNVSEGDKNVTIDEGDKNVTIDEGDKNVTYNKTTSKKKKLTSLGISAKPTASVVVSFKGSEVPADLVGCNSSGMVVKGLELSNTAIKTACRGFTKGEIDIAIQRTLGTKNRESDSAMFIHWLKNPDKWSEVESKESILDKNKAYLESKKHLDGKEFASTKIWVCKNHIEFVPNANCPSVVFSVESPTFIESVEKYIKKLEDFCETCLA